MAYNRNGTGRRRNIPLLIALDRAGITQGELAKRAGVSGATVSLLMRQQHAPHSATALKIAEVLNSSVATLFRGAYRFRRSRGTDGVDECLHAIKQYRADHPAARWKELFINIPNHYLTSHSMRTALQEAVKTRKRYAGQRSTL